MAKPVKEDIRETRLENGIVVLTDKMPGVRSATLGFFYRVGSGNEPDELNGVTHFIEHCVFKGSSKRTALEIAIEQDRLGGNLDAFTTHEETGFVVKVIDDEIDAAFDLISDMLTSPRFENADCENEQRVIIEEIKMNEDSPEDLLSDIFHREFFGTHPFGLPITGTPETVKRFDHELTSRFHARAFVPANLVIAAAGNIDHDSLAALADALPATVQQNERASLLPSPKPASPIFIEQRSDLEQAHLIIATPLVGLNDPRRYAADLLAGALGGGSSSRLWQKIREERGLAYSVGASASMYNGSGFFTVNAGTSPEQAGEVIDIVVEEMGRIAKDGVVDTELELMKDQTRASVLLSLEDSASRAGSLAQCEMVHGRQISVEESLQRVAAVTPDEVQEIAREFFKSDAMSFVAIGDLETLDVTRGRLGI